MSNKMVLILLIIICLNLPAFTAQAQDSNIPQFAFPLDCTLGHDCWTVNYVDVDPSPDTHKDFMCGAKTYEKHQGTDFALRSRLEMQSGVDVLAAMDGTVLRIRDGESDSIKTEEQYQAIREANKDCGNGVLIDHGNGLQSFYCHLKLASIVVKAGQKVKEGEKIAQIGQSGFSEFPHLHFSIIWESGHVDPFTGLGMNEGCGQFKNNLWKDNLKYAPFAVFDGGFRAGVPDFKTMPQGQINPQILAQDSPALVYWIGFYHAREGDKIDMVIYDPDGAVFSKRSVTQTINRKRPSYYYTGRQLRDRTLKPGIYKGQTTFRRDGFPDLVKTHEIIVK